MINVAYIVGFHGLKGEMKLKSTSDFIDERLNKGSKLFLVKDNYKKEVEINSVRVHKNNYLISLVGYNSLNEVEKFKGYSLKVNKDNLFDLSEDEYYHFELIGSNVFDYLNDNIGKVIKVYSNGANDVLVVKNNEDKEFHIPFINNFIEDIDTDKKEIKLYEVEGLF
ncbi:MAG: ribosome maturation factor RimM [Bacilli bacterium]|jgi:16S rRNA processing protein RimM|nr:ribosome maturation factor RimM [Bacilli bacterium]